MNVNIVVKSIKSIVFVFALFICVGFSSVKAAPLETESNEISPNKAFSVRIPKFVNIKSLNNSKAEEVYQISIGGNVPKGKTINVVPDATFTMTTKDKKPIVASVIQTKTSFTYRDLVISNIQEGTILASNFTAGNWRGKFNFTISIEKTVDPADAGLYRENAMVKNWDQLLKEKIIAVDDAGVLTVNQSSSLVGKLVVSNNAFSVGRLAFSDCKNLTSIIIPSGIESIGEYAFSGCETLSSVDISDTVTSIGKGAFSNCVNLLSIKIPKNITKIDDCAFDGCSKLSSVALQSGVTTIGSLAFNNCVSLSAITIPDTVSVLGDRAFNSCENLLSAKLSNNITSIQWGMFMGCKKLTEVTIPNKVTSIEGNSFRDCLSLPTIIIPSNVTSIGSCAFYRCQGLTSLTIPSSVTVIGENAFAGLTQIHYAGIASGGPWGAALIV